MKIDALNSLKENEVGIVIKNNIKTKNKQNIENLGVTKGTKIKCLYQSPLNDPKAYLVKNIILAIREEDSKNILISKEKNGPH